MSQSPVRTRFAPSPTGFLHIGGVRTALYNWLFARKYNGHYVLRIDDTDTERNVQEALQPILDGFEWLELMWDEGPKMGGDCGPYYQSQRGFLYSRYLDKLFERGFAYDDDGAIRFRMTSDAMPGPWSYKSNQIVLNDLVRGKVEWDATLIKDPVIVRKDGRPLYNFATVVDDDEMQITHIFRAEEHLTNTAVQLRIYDALGCKPPEFGHLAFVCAPGSKKKLSKRDMEKFLTPEVANTLRILEYKDDDISNLNPATVAYYKALGYNPMGVCNYLALLGWSLDDHTEVFTRKELIAGFDVKGIHNAPASFDQKKFLHINAEQMKRLTVQDKILHCSLMLHRVGISPDVNMMDKIVQACGDRLKTFADIMGYALFFFRDPVYDEKAFGKRLGDENIARMLFRFATDIGTMNPFEPQALETKLHDFCEANTLKVGDMVHAIRIAITGQPVGPGVFDCMSILGPGETQRRVITALKKRGIL